MSIIKQDYGELTPQIESISLYAFDYNSGQGSIAANSSKTYTTTNRLKQGIFAGLSASGNNDFVYLIDFEEKAIKVMYTSGTQGANINVIDYAYSSIVTAQTDTTVSLKNVQSYAKNYILLGWY